MRLYVTTSVFVFVYLWVCVYPFVWMHLYVHGISMCLYPVYACVLYIWLAVSVSGMYVVVSTLECLHRCGMGRGNGLTGQGMVVVAAAAAVASVSWDKRQGSLAGTRDI